MTTIVLIHGAWHGGWCWKKVAPLLRAAGHEVYTPTLTGLGDRAHLLGPAVTLDTVVGLPATPVPEPTLALFAAGLAGLLRTARKRGGQTV